MQHLKSPWLLLRRSNLSNIGDRVRAGPSNAENNPNTNPNPSLVIALLYSLCIHKIGLRISVHNFLSDLVTACNKSQQKKRVTNLLSKALQDNMHEMIDKN